jgi:hypothetical protein
VKAEIDEIVNPDDSNQPVWFCQQEIFTGLRLVLIVYALIMMKPATLSETSKDI